MTINREAADKTKGFRLQKMRVIEFMLDGITSCEISLFYSSIEYIEYVCKPFMPLISIIYISIELLA